MSARPSSGTSESPDLTERFYTELRAIAGKLFASERHGHTLQPTAAVNEACLRMLTVSPLPDVERADRLALAARVLRQVLVDHHRSSAAEKRGGGRLRLALDPEHSREEDTIADVEAVHLALEKLRALHERQAEVVTLRVFGGLSVDEVVRVLGVSRRTVEADWTVARAWLRRELVRGARGA